jgi:hypothetical protein
MLGCGALTLGTGDVGATLELIALGLALDAGLGAKAAPGSASNTVTSSGRALMPGP